MVEMKYKQKQGYGCGLYAVANALNLDNFVTDKRLEQSKTGNVIGQLSKWMQEDGLDIYIDTLYYNHLGKKLPNSALHYVPIGDNAYTLPVLLNVRFKDGGLNHLVGGKIDKEGRLLLMDSLNEEPIVTTLSKANRMYHNVYGLFLFMDVNTGAYVFFGD